MTVLYDYAFCKEENERLKKLLEKLKGWVTKELEFYKLPDNDEIHGEFENYSAGYNDCCNDILDKIKKLEAEGEE